MQCIFVANCNFVLATDITNKQNSTKHQTNIIGIES